DSTESETHAALVHDCPKGSPCMKRQGRQKQGEGMRPERVPTATFRADRQAAVDGEDDEPQPIDMGAVDEVSHVGGRTRFKIKDHWYRTLDDTAGIRAYMGERGAKRFWHGFYNQKAADATTGGA